MLNWAWSLFGIAVASTFELLILASYISTTWDFCTSGTFWFSFIPWLVGIFLVLAGTSAFVMQCGKWRRQQVVSALLAITAGTLIIICMYLIAQQNDAICASTAMPSGWIAPFVLLMILVLLAIVALVGNAFDDESYCHACCGESLDASDRAPLCCGHQLDGAERGLQLYTAGLVLVLLLIILGLGITIARIVAGASLVPVGIVVLFYITTGIAVLSTVALGVYLWTTGASKRSRDVALLAIFVLVLAGAMISFALLPSLLSAPFTTLAAIIIAFALAACFICCVSYSAEEASKPPSKESKANIAVEYA